MLDWVNPWEQQRVGEEVKDRDWEGEGEGGLEALEAQKVQDWDFKNVSKIKP
jgi:hypothetical protein